MLRAIESLPPEILKRLIAESPTVAEALRSRITCRSAKRIAERGLTDTVR